VAQDTIILGAGASRQFGFPLGKTLHTDILAATEQLERYASDHKNIGLPPTGAHNARQFCEEGIVALASYLASPLARDFYVSDVQRKRGAQAIVDFGKDLHRATHDSVDRFIGDNPSHQFIGKILLCHQILLQMYEYRDGVYFRKNFASREFTGRRNWYNLLINHIRSEYLKKKINIVTFNYDLSLDVTLEQCLNATERHRDVNFSEFVDIFHVNGAPSEAPAKLTDVGQYLMRSAQRLHLVDEAASSQIQAMRDAVRERIRGSARVYIMGFHFDGSNVESVGLREGGDKTRFFCLNFDGHRGVHIEAQNLGLASGAIWAGTVAQPFFIDEALDKGFLRL